jgi:SNF family Na+-dependent transporter
MDILNHAAITWHRGTKRMLARRGQDDSICDSVISSQALTSNIMLPFGGFALALFAGWVLPERLLAEEIGLKPGTVRLLRIFLRTIVPACIAVVTLFPLLTTDGWLTGR